MSSVVLDHLIESGRLEVVDINAGIQHQRILLNQGPILSIRIGVDVPMSHIAAYHVRPRHHWVMADVFCQVKIPGSAKKFPWYCHGNSLVIAK